MRRGFGVLVGAVVAVACMMTAEAINHRLYRIPQVDPKDKEAIQHLIATLPAGAFVLVLVGWLVGTLLGTFLAAKIGNSRVPAYIVAALLLIGGIVNAVMLPQPIWYDALSILIFVAAPFAGIAMAKPVQSAPA